MKVYRSEGWTDGLPTFKAQELIVNTQRRYANKKKKRKEKKKNVIISGKVLKFKVIIHRGD